jgi:hypothetical protein
MDLQAVLSDDNAISAWMLSADEIVNCHLSPNLISAQVLAKAAKSDDKFREGEGAEILRTLVQDAFTAVISEREFYTALEPVISRAVLTNVAKIRDDLSRNESSSSTIPSIVELSPLPEGNYAYVGKNEDAPDRAFSFGCKFYLSSGNAFLILTGFAARYMAPSGRYTLKLAHTVARLSRREHPVDVTGDKGAAAPLSA